MVMIYFFRYFTKSGKKCMSYAYFVVVDLHTKVSSMHPPNRTKFFHFYICFHQKVPVLEVGTPSNEGWHPPMGNPGSTLVLHFKMSISASKCAIIISNIHWLMYCWHKLQHMQHKNWLFFFFNVVKYDTSHLWQLIGSGLLKTETCVIFNQPSFTSFNIQDSKSALHKMFFN